MFNVPPKLTPALLLILRLFTVLPAKVLAAIVCAAEPL